MSAVLYGSGTIVWRTFLRALYGTSAGLASRRWPRSLEGSTFAAAWRSRNASMCGRLASQSLREYPVEKVHPTIPFKRTDSSSQDPPQSLTMSASASPPTCRGVGEPEIPPGRGLSVPGGTGESKPVETVSDATREGVAVVDEAGTTEGGPAPSETEVQSGQPGPAPRATGGHNPLQVGRRPRALFLP